MTESTKSDRTLLLRMTEDRDSVASEMIRNGLLRQLVHDADRLAQLEDGIRAMADKWEQKGDPLSWSDECKIRDLRALLGEDGQ